MSRHEYGSRLKGRDSGKTAAACELLVRADLLRRGYEVTVPCSATAKHDLHVDIPGAGWLGVQVKAAQREKSTGRLYAKDKNKHSPILALVFLSAGLIEYRASARPLPVELA